MTTMRAAIVLLTTFAVCAPADAAVRVGADTSTPPAGELTCGGCMAFTADTATTAASGYEVPFNGILTSWTLATRTLGVLAPSSTLRIVRPVAGANRYLGGATGSSLTSADNVVTWKRTGATRVAVSRGDLLAVQQVSTGSIGRRSVTGPRVLENAPWVDGLALTPSLTPFTDSELTISAQLEPDADTDGYGDETQDACPTQTSTQAACPAAPVTEKTVTVTVPGPTQTATLPAPTAGTPVVLARRVAVSVPVTCPATRSAACAGTVELRTAKAVRVSRTRAAVLVLGSGAFSSRPGTTANARIALSAGARTMLPAGSTLAATLRVEPADAAPSARKVTLRAPSAKKPKKRG